jgi:hypothetical protein
MRWKRRDGVMNAGARRVQRVYLVLLTRAWQDDDFARRLSPWR